MEGALLGVSSRDYNTANSSSFIQQSDNLRTDATDMSKKTAIIIAIENNNVSAVKLLVENGCRLANSANDVRYLSLSVSCFSQCFPSQTAPFVVRLGNRGHMFDPARRRNQIKKDFNERLCCRRSHTFVINSATTPPPFL